MMSCHGYRFVESEPVEPVATYVDDQTWMIRSASVPSLFWASDRGWVEMEDGELFPGVGRELMDMPGDGEWVEAFLCDECGKFRCDTGDGVCPSTPGRADAVDPPEWRFVCTYCVGRHELEDEGR